MMLLKIIVIAGLWFALTAPMTWVERRGAALLGLRLGPNRVGPFGLFQPIADGIKFLFKEDPIPGHVNKVFYVLAPLVMFLPAMMAFAVIPLAAPVEIFGQTITFQIADLDIGIFYVLAISSLSVFGIIMAGWSSNNKYALIGAMRSASQLISYELAMGLAAVSVVLASGGITPAEIITAQAEPLLSFGPVVIPRWGILVQPVGFLVFLITAYAETNRLPFDLPEGESEIIAGYHIEYGSMKFAMFYLSEYLNMITASALTVTLFFGGWQLLPGLSLVDKFFGLPLVTLFLQLGSFWLKVAFFLWLFVWVRWTLPRFRYDQLMNLGWKVLLPLAFGNLALTAALVYWRVI